MIRPYSAIALLTSMIIALLSSCAFDPYNEHGYALVFGVAEYPGPYLTPLSYTDNDAVDMAGFLGSHNFTVLNLGSEENPTRQEIEDWITSASSQVGEDDLFVFFYSGHGGTLGTLDPSEPARGNSRDEFIFPNDASTDLSNAISDDELCELIAAVPALRKVVIIDACNSGGFIGDQAEIDGNDDGNGSEGLIDALKAYAFYSRNHPSDVPFADAIVLSAAGEDELSWEQGLYQNGVFTEFFLRSAAEGDENGDGYVTVTEAYAYTARMIDSTFNIGSTEGFLPRVSGGPVDFILFNAE